MMMGNSARRVVWRRLPDVRQPALYERKHVLSGILVKEPPLTANRDVNWRGVSEQAALPFVVVMQSTGIRPAAAGRQPRMALNFERRFQMQTPRAFRLLCGGDDATLLQDLQVVQRKNRFRGSLDFQCATARRQLYRVPDARVVDAEV